MHTIIEGKKPVALPGGRIVVASTGWQIRNEARVVVATRPTRAQAEQAARRLNGGKK